LNDPIFSDNDDIDGEDEEDLDYDDEEEEDDFE
jgi:hypothetical protein